jgi:hypothetical protein
MLSRIGLVLAAMLFVSCSVGRGPFSALDGSPRARFLLLSNTTLCARDAAENEVESGIVDFHAQLVGYRHFSEQTAKFSDQLAAQSWGDAQGDVDNLIAAGRAQVVVLAAVVAATSPDDVLAIAEQVVGSERTFSTEVALVRSDLALDSDPGFMSACSHATPTPASSPTAGTV